MPRATQHPRTQQWIELRQTGFAMNEDNDCSVIAIAAVTNTPYAEVHRRLAAHGRRARRGTPIPYSAAVINELGFRIEEVSPRYFIQQYPSNHARAKNVTTHHPDRYNKVWADGHNYICYNQHHMLAVVDGTNVDWTRGRSQKVVHIWRILPNPNNLPNTFLSHWI